MPVVYTREIMPVSKDHIPTPEIADQLPHLRRLATEIPPLLDCDIALLLGTNVRKVFEPLDVFQSISDGPFAQLSILG